MDTATNPKPKTGRPRALDEVKRREICALVSAGCAIADAAKYVGCSASTIHREAFRNRQFREQLRRAHLTNELGPLNALRHASHKYWRAAAWLLERTNPQRFAKQPIKIIKPEHCQEICDLMLDVVKQEVCDPDVLERISNRLGEIQKDAEQEAWAVQYDPLYEPRRRDKRVCRPPIPPWMNSSKSRNDSPDAQNPT
jgi:hypothetical protein